MRVTVIQCDICTKKIEGQPNVIKVLKETGPNGRLRQVHRGEICNSCVDLVKEPRWTKHSVKVGGDA